MKDYTVLVKDQEIRKKEQSKFILRYEVKENDFGKKMVIYYADGRKGKIDFSSAFEQALLYLMECQVEKYKSGMQEYKKNYIEKLALSNIGYRVGLFLIYIIVIGIFGTVINFSVAMFCYVMMSLIIICNDLIMDAIRFRNEKRLIDDFAKGLLFVENKKYLEKQKEITINQLDKFTLNDLEKMIKRIKLEENNNLVNQNDKESKEETLVLDKELTIEDVARLKSLDVFKEENNKFEESFFDDVIENELAKDNYQKVKKRIRKK